MRTPCGDALGVPWAEVAGRLPEDGEAYRFNKSGEALDVSYVQIGAASWTRPTTPCAWRWRRALDRPAKTTRKLYARDERSLRGWLPRENGTLPDRLSFPVLDLARPAGCPRRPRPGNGSGDPRARGGRQGVEHLQRRGRI